MRILNRVPILLLRSPLHRLIGSGVLLLSFAGRRSGKTFTVPVNFVRTDDTILITTDSPWWKNLRGGAPVRVRIGGQTFEGTAEAVTEEHAIMEALRAMMRRFPRYGRFAGIRRGPKGQPNVGDMLREIRHGRVLVRVQLPMLSAR